MSEEQPLTQTEAFLERIATALEESNAIGRQHIERNAQWEAYTKQFNAEILAIQSAYHAREEQKERERIAQMEREGRAQAKQLRAVLDQLRGMGAEI